MKKLILLMMAGTALVACSEPAATVDTTDSTVVEEPVVTDEAVTDDVVTEDVVTDEPATTGDFVDGDDVTAEEVFEDQSSLANDDNGDLEEELDMAAGDGIEGTVENWDADGQTFTLMEGSKAYAVIVTPATVYMEGDRAWESDDFFGEDRMGRDVAVEGEISDSDDVITATKVTLY